MSLKKTGGRRHWASHAGACMDGCAWRTQGATAQILLSPDDTETRRKHLNARATMGALLELGAVPVVNENDTVATAEIRFGDNDRLAARVAAMIGPIFWFCYLMLMVFTPATRTITRPQRTCPRSIISP